VPNANEKKSTIFCQHAMCVSKWKYAYVFCVGQVVGATCLSYGSLNVSFFAMTPVTVAASVGHCDVSPIIRHTISSQCPPCQLYYDC
jgi:hypothetical protein